MKYTVCDVIWLEQIKHRTGVLDDKITNVDEVIKNRPKESVEKVGSDCM